VFKSIQKKLMFLVLSIVVISLSLLSFLIYQTASRAVRDRVEKETLSVSAQVSRRILRPIEASIHIIQGLSKTIPAVINIDDALVEQHEVLTEFGHLFVTDAEGILTNVSPHDQKLKGLNLSKTDYVSYVKKVRKVFVSEPQTGFFGYPAIVIAVPIFIGVGTEKLEFFGIVGGTLKLETLFSPAMNLQLGRSGFAVVLDQNGLLLSHPDPGLVLQKKITEVEADNPSLEMLWTTIREKKEGVLEYRYHGQTHIAGYAQVGMNNWSVLTTLPLKEVLTDVEKLKAKALGLTGGFLGFAILCTFFVARSISKPLVAMTREVQAFVGSTIQNISTRNRDEVSILAASMKALINYLREMASVANQISQGDPSPQIEPKSQGDVLGHAFTQMTQYFREMAEIANKLAHGDLSQDVQPKSERDVLGFALQNMVTEWRLLVAQIQNNADQITKTSAEVLTRSEQDLQTAENITSSVEETSSAMTEMKASSEEVSEITKTLFSATEEISTITDQMFSSIRQIAGNAKELSELAETTAGAMSQMVASVERIANDAENSKRFYQETTENAVQGQTSVQQVVTSMDKIRRAVSSAAQTIQSLEDKSQEIGSILDVIDGIADQTALLALNASILAAQAGEHGRGFAVVADEIKELASRVALSTKEIGRIIQNVQQQSADAAQGIREGNVEVDEGVRLAHQAGQSLNRITVSAQSSLSAAQSIVSAIQEQKESTQKITKSVRRVTERISEINQATQEQERGSSRVLQAIEEVRNLTNQVKHATSEQAKGAGQVDMAMEGVRGLIMQNRQNAHQSTQDAERLALQAETLRTLVGRFALNGH